ncbi:MAG: alpha/beta hydrolase-fold protein [Gemmatimonadota bacterium]
MQSARSAFRAAGCLAVALTSTLAAQAPAMPAHSTFTILSHAVGETRTINVYTPPGYDAGKQTRYAVLYMPDGGVAEDFPHVVISVDSLIRHRKIPPTLVVGIENTQRRRDMTGPTTVTSDSAIAPRVGGSAAFRSFIRDELIPEVKHRYRTTDETAIVGESLAGLFIVETFLYEPSLFRRYIAISPSVWWNRDELVGTAEARLAVGGMQGRRLYLTAANEQGISTGTATIAALLKAKPPTGLIWWYVPRPDLEHGTIYLGQGPAALARALR